MSDNEDWRRRKAEELGLTNSGPWISHTPRPPAPATEAALPRAPDAGAVRASAQGNAAEGAPTPLRTPSDVPDDVIYIDRRRRARPARPPAPSAASSAATSPGFARHRWRTRAATILAIGAGLSLALIIGLWLRGAAVPADAPLVVPTTAVPSSGAAAPAASSEPALSDASAAAGAKPEPMVDVIPEPAQPRFPSAATPPSADYAPLIMPAPPVASPPLAASPHAESAPAAAQYRAEQRARLPLTTSEEAASRPDRPGDPRALLPASRGRFTAPRAVAASGRDFSPSFNCRRATSWVNRMVCNDEELAALDVRMSDAYGSAIAAAGPAGERRIDADQARFLGQRTRCRTATCVDRAYRIRIDELDPSN